MVGTAQGTVGRIGIIPSPRFSCIFLTNCDRDQQGPPKRRIVVMDHRERHSDVTILEVSLASPPFFCFGFVFCDFLFDSSLFGTRCPTVRPFLPYPLCLPPSENFPTRTDNRASGPQRRQVSDKRVSKSTPPDWCLRSCVNFSGWFRSSIVFFLVVSTLVPCLS